VPELPEAEASRALIADALGGKRIEKLYLADDEIVFSGVHPNTFHAALEGAKVTDTCRKGKYFWVEFDRARPLAIHLGMSGSVLDITPGQEKGIHYKNRSPKDMELDEEQRPRWCKMVLYGEDGSAVAVTDKRRFGRIWQFDSVEGDKRLGKLGPDALAELPQSKQLGEMLAKRNTSIKALLLNQSFLSGIGNWIADEVLYQAGIAPMRLGSELAKEEIKRLRNAIHEVLKKSVEAKADYEQFPKSWMFHHRWGGGKGQDVIDGHAIRREEVAGRTTAWVPDKQK
jgi:formamidopyrimidine-DNA glycosylase